MASFAKLNNSNFVEQVISVHNNELLNNGIESEEKGISFCKSLYGQDTNWKQTSYNTHGGKHLLGGTPFRKNHASIGFLYDETRNAFIPPKRFDSWTLNEETCLWEPPVLYPNDGAMYDWNEETKTWDLKTL